MLPFVVVSRMEKVREVGIEPTERFTVEERMIHATTYRTRAVTMLLARDAHPFALTLQSYRGRGLSGSRLRLHTLCRYASGLVLYFCYRGCITRLSVGAGEFLKTLLKYFARLKAGSLPFGSGSPSVHPLDSAHSIGLPPTYALDRLSSPFMSWTSEGLGFPKAAEGNFPWVRPTRGTTKPPRVWHYEGGDLHGGDLCAGDNLCSYSHTRLSCIG